MNKKMSKKKKLLFLIITGVLLSGVSAFASYLINSSEVEYNPETSGLSSTNVQGAIDELYSRTSTLQSEKEALQQQLENAISQEDLEAAQAACPSGKDCVKKVETDTDTPTEYDINGEKFIVIWSNQYETALISKYNVSTSTGKQVSSGAETLEFSIERYWSDGSALKADYTANGASFDGNPYPYVYNSQSNLYTYLENYKTYLNSSKVKLVRLATYEELANLGCTDSNTCPSWIKNTSFWTGSAQDRRSVCYLDANRGYLYGNFYSNSNARGVRPVIVVSTSEL